MMTWALVVVALLMCAGMVLRLRVPMFRALYIPASVIAGMVGLAIVQWLIHSSLLESFGGLAIATEMSKELSGWPGWLIAVVFATLLLVRRSGTNMRAGVRRTASQAVMVWIIVLGQTSIGLWVTWLLIQPFYDVPNSTGMLIETGFAGGHGTAAAMGLVFSHPSVGLESGLDLGILMATAGLIFGVVTGIFWINVAAAFGWSTSKGTDRLNATDAESSPDFSEPSLKQAIGFQVIDRQIIDPLLLQAMWVALALGVGLGLQWCVGNGANWMDKQMSSYSSQAVDGTVISGADAELAKRLSIAAVLGSFPLFIYTLLGGWLVRRGLRLLGREAWIDNETIHRLSAVAMDVLVVAAIASLNLQAVASLLVPFSLLLVAGCIWAGVCLMVLSRWILPKEHWFQLGLINYGMSTGTTATGFVLLRVVDPELRTQAAEDYALAAPFSAPFIGGGMITVALPLLVLERVPIWASCIVTASIVVGLILLGLRLSNPGQQAKQ